MGGRDAHPAFSKPVEALADEDIHSDAPVLRLAFDRIIACKRVCFCHASGRQHAIGFPTTGLLQVINHATSPLFAKFLVKLLVTRGICISYNQQQRVAHPFGSGSRSAKIVFRLSGQYRLTRVKIHISRALDVILVDLAHAAAQGVRCRCLLVEALGSTVMDHRCGLEISVLKIDPACDQAFTRLHGLDSDRDAIDQRCRRQPAAIEAEKNPCWR